MIGEPLNAVRLVCANPFPPLPGEFTGPSLKLHFRFLYNPENGDVDGTSTSPVVHAVLAKAIEESGLPEYPKKAREDKVEGMVRLEAQIAPDGTVESVAAVEGSLLLGNAASATIRKWQFHPAQRDAKAIEDRVWINVEFRLDGEQVHAQIVGSEKPDLSKPAP